MLGKLGKKKSKKNNNIKKGEVPAALPTKRSQKEEKKKERAETPEEREQRRAERKERHAARADEKILDALQIRNTRDLPDKFKVGCLLFSLSTLFSLSLSLCYLTRTSILLARR